MPAPPPVRILLRLLAAVLLMPGVAGTSQAASDPRPLAGILREDLPLGAERGVLRGARVSIPDPVRLFDGVAPGRSVAFDLFADTVLRGTVEREVRRDGNSVTWYGSLEGSPAGFFQVTVHRDAVVGVFHAGGPGPFEIRPLGGGRHEIRELEAWPDTGCEPPVPPRAAPVEPPTALLRDSGDVLDVLVMYTNAARLAAGGQSGIEAVIYAAVDQTNFAYGESGIAPRIRLVHFEATPYVESGSCGTDLNRLTFIDGFMDGVHALRDTYGADLVHLITSGNSGDCCGIAWLLTSLNPGFEQYAFGLTEASCALGFTFAHELGHNQGCCHAPGDGGGCTGGALYPYSVGYRFTGDSSILWRTIMAYAPGQRIPHFSNPDVHFDGQPTGVPVGELGQAHNAATIDASALTVANFRTEVCSSPLPSVTLLSPHGGAPRCAGAVETVTWTSSEEFFYLFTLDVSTDGGATWTPDGDGTGHGTSGSFEWIVPHLPTVNGRVRVTIRNCAGSASDASTSSFAILSDPPVTAVTAPDGGESLCAGSLVAITWTNAATLCPATSWAIDYSTDGGSSWTFVDAGPGDGGGIYGWIVPETPTTQGRVRVTLSNLSGSSADASDADFTITATGPTQPLVISPNGGESWAAGSVRDIVWENLGCGAVTHRIDYSSDAGGTWVFVHADSGTGGGAYAWTVPSGPTTAGRVRVTLDNATFSRSDASDANFTIFGPPAPFALEPSGGEVWVEDTPHPIAWSNGGGPVGSHAIEYSTDGGGTWLTVVPTTPGDGGGAYLWTVPATPTGAARVRVTLANEAGSASVDGGTFVIAAAAPFVDATGGPLGGAGSSGVAWVDVDGDGDDDLCTTSPLTGSGLFLNDGFGEFVDVTPAALAHLGLDARASTWADCDNDGDLDVYVAVSGGPNKLVRNDGGGAFTDVTAPPLDDAGSGVGAAWADHDGDGDVDLYLANLGQANRLLRNDGGSFTDVTSGLLGDTGFTNAVSWADADLDGDVDLYVVNLGANRLLRNDGGGAFTDASAGGAGDAGAGFGAAWGDYDGDGDPDLYVANAGPNVLLRNDGALTFTNVTAGALGDTGTGAGCTWVDSDLDGDLDLYLVNQGQANKLFRNDGGAFADATSSGLGDGGQGRGVASADADGNGAPDLYLVNAGSDNRLFLNFSGGGNHWLRVRLVGTVSNRAAVGARVRVVAGGRSRHREVGTATGYLSQASLVPSFGLGASTQADVVEVRWPSGIVQTLTGVAADQLVEIVESELTLAPDVAQGPSIPAEVRLHPCAPNPFRDGTSIRYDLPRDGHVELRVYDVLGRLVRVLVRGEAPAGVHRVRWDRRDGAGSTVAPGVYFCRLQTPAVQQNRKMVVVGGE